MHFTIYLLFIQSIFSASLFYNDNYCLNNKSSLYCKNRVVYYLIIILISLGILAILIFFIVSCVKRIKRKRFNERDRRNGSSSFQNDILIKKKISYLFIKNLIPIYYCKKSNCLEKKCSICLDKFTVGNQICISPCKHIFHYSCIKNYMFFSKNTLCPLCKYDYLKVFGNKYINFEDIKILSFEKENYIFFSNDSRDKDSLNNNVLEIKRNDISI